MGAATVPNPKFRSQALALLAIVVGMLMLSFAAVPLYRLFCQVTGFAGTPGRAEEAPGLVLKQKMNVFFNSDVDPNLPWKFRPLQKDVTFPIGQSELIFFEAENNSNKTITGMASFNVAPDIAGAYFVKVECFCYEELTLKPHQKINLPVSFYIDPEIINNPDLKGLTNMTLSYTFFNVKEPK